MEHVSSAILEPAIQDVYVVSAFVAAALLAVAFLMPTRVVEPDAAGGVRPEPLPEPEADTVA